MKPVDLVIIVILALILGCAVAYIVRAKKSGKKCIGCPDSGHCPMSGGCCHCADPDRDGGTDPAHSDQSGDANPASKK